MQETQRSGLKKGELVLIILAILILGGSGFVYFTGFPIGKYLLGLTEGASAKQVAVLSQSAGTVRREKEGDAEFRGVNSGAPLYDEDTIVTSPESTDRITFRDGSYIEMAPSTMVKLTFGADLTLGGVVRTATVEVVSGHISGESKSKNFSVKKKGTVLVLRKPEPKPAPIPTPHMTPVAFASPPPAPSPTPSPTPSPSPSPSPRAVPVRFEAIYPKTKTVLAVANGSQVAEVPVTFEWKLLSPPDPSVTFYLVQRSRKSRILFRKKVALKERAGKLPLALKLPGNYRWAVGSATDSKKIYGYADFTIDPVYQAIQLNPTLFGGVPAENNQLRGKVMSNYDINFSWQPYEKMQKYEILLYLQPDAKKPIWAGNVQGTSYDMNHGSVFTGRAYYRVVARMPSGFVVMSPVQQFGFDLIPPSPATPETGTELSKKTLMKGDNAVLFTWQKTNFTHEYQLEISTDPGFATPLVSQRTSDNFFSLKDPQAGTYYWRVRGFSENGKASPPSEPATLTITP